MREDVHHSIADTWEDSPQSYDWEVAQVADLPTQRMSIHSVQNIQRIFARDLVLPF